MQGCYNGLCEVWRILKEAHRRDTSPVVLPWQAMHSAQVGCQTLGLRGGAPTSLNLHTATLKKKQPGSGKQSFAITNTGNLEHMQ